MSLKLLTNLIFEPKGVHDPALTYSIKDTVMSPDGSKVYFALRDVPSGIALTDEDYWMLQIDLSGSKNAMDEAVAAFADYAKIVGTRVKGETAKAAGNPVSFLPDAGSLLQPVTVLTPQQEGSGDPYPAGGGRNLLPNIISAHTHYGITFTPNDDGSITVNGTNTSANAAATCIFGNVDFEGGKTYSISGVTGYEANTLQICVQSTDAFPAGSRLQSFDGAVTRMAAASESCEVRVQVGPGVTLNNVKIYPMLAEGTDATYAPYSNIRPFIGYDKLGLNVTGKNLFDASTASADKRVRTDTGELEGFSGMHASDYIAITHGKSYTLNFSYYSTGNYGMAFYDSRKRYISGIKQSSVDQSNAEIPFTFVAPDESAYVRFSVASSKPATEVMMEFGTVSSDFKSYTGKLNTVQIGQTVYGFRYEWLTGKGVIEWVLAKGVFTRAALDSSGKLYAIAGISSTAKPYPTTQAGEVDPYIACTALPFKALEVARGYDKPCISQYGTGIYIGGFVGREAELDALIASDDFAVACKLATPIEIQLTPHIISAVDPEQTNTLYGDGTIEVEYVKPLHVSIEERVAAAIAALSTTE